MIIETLNEKTHFESLNFYLLHGIIFCDHSWYQRIHLTDLWRKLIYWNWTNMYGCLFHISRNYWF